MACLSSTGLTINKYKTYNYGLNNDSLNNNNIIICYNKFDETSNLIFCWYFSKKYTMRLPCKF